MIYRRKINFMKNMRRLFSLLLVVSVFFFGFRVYANKVQSENSDGLVINVANQYTPGSISDRNGACFVWGTDVNTWEWAGDLNEQRAFSNLLGLNVKNTVNSRMTVLGSCNWVYGTEDDRLGIKSMLQPNQERVGGDVQLTVDKELQTYIYKLLRKKGYDKAAVVVSNYQTGEILAAVSTPTFSPQKDYQKVGNEVIEDSRAYSNVLSKRYNMGSTIKPIIAAVALTINPKLKNYEYVCKDSNHVFKTKEGKMIRIDCAGKASHGKVDMEKALTCSCNGYFVSLLQKLPMAKVLEKMKDYGFDKVVSYEQLAYYDHTFFTDNSKEVDYMMGAIGQSNAKITPLGLNLCIGALLNEGVMMEPRIVKAKSNTAGGELVPVETGTSTRVCEEKVAEQVKKMMSKVAKQGTGRSFYMKNLACKTGTAQRSNAKGKLTGKNTIWTVAGLTSSKTPYCITVCVDDMPAKVSSANAGKVATKILKRIIGGN